MGAYTWTSETPPALPKTLPPAHQPSSSGLAEAIDEGVGWILESVGLMDALAQVTGNGGALHEAATVWLEQAQTLQSSTQRLRQGASPLPEAWQGGASDAFGTFMGRCVADLDLLARNLAETARILNQAGIEAAVAEDLVTTIVSEAAQWAAAELATTIIADVLTLGAASAAGGLAESATMATFVERAAAVSARLGRALEELSAELRQLQDAREAIRAAEGMRKLAELRRAQATLRGLPLAGSGFEVLNIVGGQAVGVATGLPMGSPGADGLKKDIAKEIAGTALHGVQRSRANQVE